MTKTSTRRRKTSALANKAALQKAVEGSVSKKDILVKMGLRAAGGNYAALDKWAGIHGLELPVSTPGAKRIAAAHMKNRVPDSEVFVEDSEYTCRRGIKNRLRSLGFPQKCGICGLGDTWNGQPLVLQLDHKNGRSNDHRIGNLRLLCPNCHAQTTSFRGANVKPVKKCECGSVINSASQRCSPCAAKHRARSISHCPRGHELKEPNLRPSAMRKGKRICLACDRARSHCTKNGIMDSFVEVSDSYYSNIMKEDDAA